MGSNWPTPQEYNEALQNPLLNFADETLKTGKVSLNPLGLPHSASGAFASVYKLSSKAGTHWAVRCFLNPRSDQKERYTAISKFVAANKLSCTVPFYYLDKGLRVGGRWYPILKMAWVDGDTLDVYLQKNYKCTEMMATLGKQFSGLANELEKAGIAHGDLQHGNIMVTADGLRLVDYDGLFVPELSGLNSLEIGHANYQHPERTDRYFDTTVDNFSCWLIHTSLQAVYIDPGLFERLGNGDDCILLKRRDLKYPEKSLAFSILFEHPSEIIRENAKLLLRMLWSAPQLVPELSATVDELTLLPDVKPEKRDFTLMGIEALTTGDDARFDELRHRLAEELEFSEQQVVLQSEAKSKRSLWSSFLYGLDRFYRKYDPLIWINFKVKKADELYKELEFEQATNLYIDIYTRMEELSRVQSAHYFNVLCRLGFCYAHIGNFKRAHNFFLLAYSRSLKVASPPEQTRVALLQTICLHMRKRTEAISSAFDKCNVELIPDIVPFQLEQICTTDRVLRLLSDLWLERSKKALQSIASQIDLIKFFSALLEMLSEHDKTAPSPVDTSDLESKLLNHLKQYRPHSWNGQVRSLNAVPRVLEDDDNYETLAKLAYSQFTVDNLDGALSNYLAIRVLLKHNPSNNYYGWATFMSGYCHLLAGEFRKASAYLTSLEARKGSLPGSDTKVKPLEKCRREFLAAICSYLNNEMGDARIYFSNALIGTKELKDVVSRELNSGAIRLPTVFHFFCYRLSDQKRPSRIVPAALLVYLATGVDSDTHLDEYSVELMTSIIRRLITNLDSTSA
ncbi:MAG: hypothetical protein K2Z81_11835 [Cyanobacteria bacterium]|nr:hypothetical protein [Cyanobacteriota bacterium]